MKALSKNVHNNCLQGKDHDTKCQHDNNGGQVGNSLSIQISGCGVNKFFFEF